MWVINLLFFTIDVLFYVNAVAHWLTKPCKFECRRGVTDHCRISLSKIFESTFSGPLGLDPVPDSAGVMVERRLCRVAVKTVIPFDMSVSVMLRRLDIARFNFIAFTKKTVCIFKGFGFEAQHNVTSDCRCHQSGR